MLDRRYKKVKVDGKLIMGKGASIVATSSAGVETTLDMTELAALNDIAASDLAKIDGITDGTAAANKAVVLDASKGISTITSATVTTLTSTTGNITSVNTGAIVGTDSSLGITGLTPATTVAGGEVVISGAASVAGATGAGGAVTLNGGASGATNAAGGAVIVNGGLGTGTGNGGAVTITSGAAGATGVAGAIALAVGAATAGAGSSVTITGGAGAGGTAAGGNIDLVPGVAVSTGVPGEVKVNGAAGLFEATFFQPLSTTAAPASGSVGTFFIANRAYRVKAVSAIEATFGTSETYDVYKDTGTNAPGAGTSVLTGVMTMAVSNTRVVGTVSTTVATVTLAAGDRLSYKVAGTVGLAAGLAISVTLVPI